MPFDLASVSGHKIGAPKGIGAMFIRRGIGDRAAVARRLAGSRASRRAPRTSRRSSASRAPPSWRSPSARRSGAVSSALRDKLEEAILARIPDAVIHGRGAPQRAPHIVNISVPGTDSESMLMALDLRGIALLGGLGVSERERRTRRTCSSAIGVAPELGERRRFA